MIQLAKSRLASFILIFIFGSVTGALLAEIFLQSVLGMGMSPLSIAHPTIEYMFKPNQRLRPFGNLFVTNSYGMRSEEFPQRKSDPNEVRILVFGDSVVNGGNLTDQEQLATTIVARRLSAQRGRHFVVGNVSAGSWGPENWAAYLKEFGTFDADLLIVVASSHDFRDLPTFKQLDPTTHPTQHSSALWEAIFRYAPRYLPRAGRELVGVTRGVGSTTGAVSSAESSAGAIAAIGGLAGAIGIPVCMIHHSTRAEIEEGRLVADGKELITAARNSRIGVFDDSAQLKRAMENGKMPYRDDIHVNAVGQKVLADILEQVIETCLGRSPA